MRGKGKAVNKRLTKGIGWLAALMMCCLMLVVAPTSAWAVEDSLLHEVYVSKNGNDETGDGSASNPVATLAKAVALAASGTADNPTKIYVMSDLTMTASARYWNKYISISSYGGDAPFTVTRGEFTKVEGDPARGSYNAAMIEVNGFINNGVVSALRLTNIIFDDNGMYEGEYFLQADSEGDGTTTVGTKEVFNTAIVQDGIIATYNGVGTITLGQGAILKNYGGMSAVRLSGGELIMESGSQIIDDHGIGRKKGTTGSYGPAGAIWLQGGTLTMNGGVIGGAEGVTMNGRAVYVDGGVARIGGTIQNLKGADASWQGQNGVAVHLRSSGEATLTGTGRITNVTGTNSAIWTQYCNFTADKGSTISHVDGFQLLDFDDYGQNYIHKVLLDGNITDCASGSASLMRSWYGQITLGPNSVIENCSSSSAGGLIYSNNGSHYTFMGIIRNNTAYKGMIYMANQGGGTPIAIIESTAHIIDNTGLAIRVNNGSIVTMNGGEIARNSSYGVQVSGKADKTDVTFIMNGGQIVDNDRAGIQYAIGGQSIVELNGGTIAGNNGGDAEVVVFNDYTDAPNAYPTNSNDHIKIKPGVISGTRTVQVKRGYSEFLGISVNRLLGTITLDKEYGDVGLAYANPSSVTEIETLVKRDSSRVNWQLAMGDAYWIKPNSSSYHFMVTRPSKAKKTDLYLAYIPMDADGTVPDDAELKLKKVGSENQIDVALDGLDADTAYAFTFVNSSEYTLAADDVTKYIGGGAGDEITGDGFPELTIANSVDAIESLSIKGEEVEGNDLMAELLKNLDVTYTSVKTNEVATDDSVPGEYVATLSWKNGLTNDDVRINGNNVNLDGRGTLIIRHIDDVEGAQNGTSTYKLLTDKPEVAVEHAVAMANGERPGKAPEFYTNDDESREVDAKGIQLLDDGLLKYEGENRATPMEDKGDSYLDSAGEGKEWSYEFHYLDLVDAYNGNAWVSSSGGATVYLPYPEGITVENAASLGVTVIHYKDLHREYGITGQADVEKAIEACDMETMNAEFTKQGIKFDTERAGFSPFAIAWKTDAPDEPDTPVTPPSKHYTITASAGEGGSISPSGTVSVAAGADKTFTFTPDEGNRVADVIVDGKSLGALGSYTFEDVREDHTIKVVFKAGNAPADPDDTGVSDWLNTKDHDVYLHGYQDGSNTFKPNGNMTRGEVACMFYNLLLDKSMGDASVAFEDVPEGAFYAEPIRVLASRGILFGTSPTTFAPDRPITRAEFTAIAMRFSKGDLSGENIFVDVPEGAWYYDVIVGSIKYGWIYGYQDGSHRFGPDDTITRAEATCIANRMLGRLPDGAYIAEHKDELKLFADVTEEHFAWRDIIEATNAHDYVKDGGYEDWTSLKDGADA